MDDSPAIPPAPVPPPTPASQAGSVPPLIQVPKKRQASAFIKFIRIFLLVLILIGIGLLVTQNFWVPKLVAAILGPQEITSEATKATTATSTPIIEQSGFVASTTNPLFHTYVNHSLGYSIDVPVAAYNRDAECPRTVDPFENGGQPYYESISGDVPIDIVNEGNTSYIDFSYFYQLENENSNYFWDSCEKVNLSTWVSAYLKSPNQEQPVYTEGDDPISINITNEATLDDAFSAAQQDLLTTISTECELTMASDTQAGVTDLVVSSKPNPALEFDAGCYGVPVIKYNTNTHELATIKDRAAQYCEFGPDSGDTCWNPIIDQSFKFLNQ